MRLEERFPFLQDVCSRRPFLLHGLWIIPFIAVLWLTLSATLSQSRETYLRTLENQLRSFENAFQNTLTLLNNQTRFFSHDNAIQVTLALKLTPQLEEYVKRNLFYLNLHQRQTPIHLAIFDEAGHPLLKLPARQQHTPIPACQHLIERDPRSERFWLTARNDIFYNGRRVGSLCLFRDLESTLVNALKRTTREDILYFLIEGETLPHTIRITPPEVQHPTQASRHFSIEQYVERDDHREEVLEQTFQIQDRTFRIALHARPFSHYFLRNFRTHQSLWLLIVTLLVTFILYLLLQTRLNRKLRQEKRKNQAIVQSLDEGILIIDQEGRVLHHNPAADGLVPEDGAPLWRTLGFLDAETDHPLPIRERILPEVMRRRGVWRSRTFVRMIGPDGVSHYVSLTLRAMPEAEETALLVIDFEDRVWQLLEEIRWQATHHALTRLLNYRGLKQQVELILRQARADHDAEDDVLPLAFILINFDHFKTVNDALGHTLGDLIIRRMAEKLEGFCADQAPAHWQLAQLEGAEFGLLVHQSLDALHPFIDALLEACRIDFAYQNQQYRFTASIGATPLYTYDADLDQVLNRVSIAVQFVKKQGGNNAVTTLQLAEYTSRQQQTLSLLPWVQKALRDDLFELVGQRIQDLNNPQATPRFEVLLRLRDADGRPISPALFIPAAEQFGLVRDIDRWVIRNVIRNIAELFHYSWNSAYLFSINLSSVSLADETLFDYIRQQCEQHSVPLHGLAFEVTETAVMSNLESARTLLRKLHDAGATLLLDDFGTGMSSLAYLKEFPIDVLKIDGSFIRNLLDNPTDRAIVAAITTLATQLHCRTVAEFVENEQLITALRGMGIDYGQGYGIEAPKPLAHCIEELMQVAVPAPAVLTGT